MRGDRFLDSNILIYAQQDHPHGEKARALVSEGGKISIQVLNELTNVLRRKLLRSWDDIEEVLADLAVLLPPARPILYATHCTAVSLCRHIGCAIYDGLILASALEAGCQELLSEDFQHGRQVGALIIRNPFLG
jgi:predicted nucleic acid-binding protein